MSQQWTRGVYSQVSLGADGHGGQASPATADLPE